MPTPQVLIAHNSGDNLPAQDWNDNFAALESAIGDLGPYILTGLVPSAGAGLSVSVTAGTAVILTHVSVGAFSIPGLAPSTVNHLYLLQNGSATSNTTGTAPANSVKLGTATTGVATVTSVDTTPLSGRQVKVSLTTLVTTGSNVFSAQNVFLLDDATNNAATYPIILRHTVAAGVGANNIGVGIQLEAENTGGTVSQLGTFSLIATNDIAANLTTQYQFKVVNNGNPRTMMTVGATDVRIEQSPPASANSALLSLGGGGYAGGAGNFVGSANGTFIACNIDAGYSGDYENYQSDGVVYRKLTGSGVQTNQVWDGSGSAVSQVLLLQHMSNAGVGAAGIGARLSFGVESTTGDTPDEIGSIDLVATTATHTTTTSRMDLRVTNAGAFVTPLSLAPAVLTLADAVNLVVGTGTGSKIGTATTQKLGFFNATPVTQRAGASAAGIAAITDANAQNAISALQNALNALGFVTAPA